MMWRNKSINKLYAFALAAVFSLTLAGCGGGGGGTAEEPAPPVVPDTRLEDARERARLAAEAANMALNMAKAAVDGVSALQTYDQLHYGLAEGGLSDARRAKQAADAAYARAQATESWEAAEDAADDAEEEMRNAQAGRDNAVTFAGEVQQAKDDKDEMDRQAQLTLDLQDAVDEATKARMEADQAADDADTYVTALIADPDASTQQVADAKDSQRAAHEAAQDAKDAEDAAKAAQIARDLQAAQMARDNAISAKNDAVAASGSIKMAKQGLEDDRKEVMDLDREKGRAMTAAGNARQKANDAQTAANEVAQLVGASSAQAIAAQEAADEADKAADEAEAANSLAQAATESSVAAGYADTAEGKDGEANTQLLAANELLREARVAANVGDKQQEARDIKSAQDAAMLYRDNALVHLNGGTVTENGQPVSTSGAILRIQLIDEDIIALQGALTKATYARTDAETVKAKLDQALVIQTRAHNALPIIQDAVDAAEAAYQKALEATTREAAETARDEAKQNSEIARDYNWNRNGMGIGWTNDGVVTVDNLLGDANTAADTHVLRLLRLANAVHIRTAPDDEANSDETEAEILAKLKSTHVGLVNTEIAEAAVESTNGNSQAAVTSTATWNYFGDLGTDNTVGGTGADADSEPGEGKISLTVTIGGTAYTTTRDDPSTMDDDESNFRAERGLGDFNHGFDIAVNADDGATPPVLNNRMRIIAFTDKEQANAPSPARTAAVQNAAVSASQVVEASPANGIDGAEFDHDNDPDTDPLPGTFTCATDATCSITIGDGGEVTAISGYTFTSTGFPSGQVIVDAVATEEDDSYLAFGFWLQDDADSTDNAARYTFGAFASGGSAYDANATNAGTVAAIEGTATYEGSAAGVRSTAGRVDFFSGDATLTANFREAETDNLGTITGRIHNIYAGGVPLGHDIYLNDDGTPANGNIADTGRFNGDARMGAGTTVDAVTTYPFNGTWSGGFYNQVLDNPATADVTESETAPGSVAGTFGVTRPDDADTEDVNESMSFVGAFGAHKQ